MRAIGRLGSPERMSRKIEPGKNWFDWLKTEMTIRDGLPTPGGPVKVGRYNGGCCVLNV